jgi:hypothetical protein
MWHRVIPDELQVGELRPLQIEGKPLLIGRTEQGYFAVLDRCSHENQPLSEADGLPGASSKGCWSAPTTAPSSTRTQVRRAGCLPSAPSRPSP